MVNPDSQASVQQAAENPIKSEFLEKVGEIPAVHSAKEIGTAMYNQVKGYNSFTAAALTAAETTALYLAITAKPFLEKVQPQAQAIDKIACKGLETVEEKVPFLMKPPEELVDEARKLAAETMVIATQRVEDVKAYGAETFSNVKNYGVEKVNKVLDETEDLVNKYLPPAFGEGSSEVEESSSSVPERASKLTSKIGLRLYGHSIKRVMPLHNLSEESASKLAYTLELLTQLKQNVSNKSIQEYVDEAKVKASWIWDELNKEPSESTEAEKSLEQRALSLARRTTSVLVHAYNVTTLPLSSFPRSYQDTLKTASRYASELFTQIDQQTNAGEITISWLQSVRQRVSSLEEVIQNLKAQEIEMENLEKADSEKVEEPVKVPAEAPSTGQ